MLRFYAVVVVVAFLAFARGEREERGVFKIHSLKINGSAGIAKS